MNLTQLILGLSALTMGVSMPLSGSGHRWVFGATHNPDNPLVTPLVAASRRSPVILDPRTVQGELKFKIPLTGYRMILQLQNVTEYNVPGIKYVFSVSYVHRDNTETQLKGLTDRHSNLPPSVVAQCKKAMINTSVKLLDFESDQERIEYQNNTVGALWNHKSNAYIRYPHLTDPKPKVLKKLVKKLQSTLESLDQAYFQVQLDSNHKLVNSGLVNAESFKTSLKKQLISVFGLPQKVLLIL